MKNPPVTSYSMVIAESFSSKIRNKTRMPTLTTFIQHSFGSPSYSNKRRKRNKRNPNWKRRVKLSLFADDMILYVENPKDTARKLLELINKFGKITGYKINTQKSVAFLYNNNKSSVREIQETIPFTVTPKKNKIPRNKPT